LHNANLSAVKIGQMKSVETKSAILDRAAVRRKIRRMALEIAERNTGEKELVIAGIVGNGVVVAQNVAAELQRIVAINITVISIELNKKTPGEVSITPLIDFEDKVVIMGDAAHAMVPFFGQGMNCVSRKQCQTNNKCVHIDYFVFM